jgi:ABC-type antimicrobial peptide transport system permease subunit
MDRLRQDIRYALRRLIKSPAFTTVALLTLALGIGANTAIFSVVNAVLLKPLPYRDAHEIVGVFHLSDGQRATMSGPNFTDVRKQATTLEDVAAYTRSRTILTGRGQPVRLDGAQVSASLFDLLGVAPALGLGGAFMLTEWLVARLLFNTSPHDPATFTIVGLVLALVAMTSAYVPARRATRVDPIVALRAE